MVEMGRRDGRSGEHMVGREGHMAWKQNAWRGESWVRHMIEREGWALDREGGTHGQT